MSKTKRIIFRIIAYFLIFTSLAFCNLYFMFLHHYKGKKVVYNWSQSDEFDISSIKTITKQKDKDFVILNLADIQICDLEDFFNRRIIHDEISYLIEQAQPDLITLTGDQTWSNENLISLKTIIGWLDSYKIPYAPVFGNHDYGNSKDSAVASQNYCCDLYENGKYSLFSRGPTNLGTLGNYAINILEDNKIVKTLYMLDSGYEDKITDMQISWMSWVADGIKQHNNNEYSQGMCFFHKPIPEYYYAYRDYYNGSQDVQAIGDVHVHFSLYGSEQNGFFEMAKSKNIKDIVCGHQHGNNFTIKYQDVRLTFALKTGELCSYYDDGITNLNGATKFTIKNDTVNIENIYVKSDQFHISDRFNIYKN